jgi:DNA-binding winged helix-turn-helix (wHTH) protein
LPGGSPCPASPCARSATIDTVVVLRFGDCELLPERFELRRRGEPVLIEPKVLHLLSYLVAHRARAVSREELSDALWPGVAVGSSSLKRLVLEARRAIGDADQSVIVTVRGMGLRFEAPVVEASASGTGETSVVHSCLVERETPLVAVDLQLVRARGGRAASCWISGVAGAGKTSLLDELANRAATQGFDVWSARCHESTAAQPLRPWLALLEGRRSEGGAGGKEWCVAREALVNGGGGDAAYESVARALAASRSPRVLSFDDLQWADSRTLDLLRFVVREVRDAPLLVACAFRETSDHEQSAAIAGLVCEHGAVQLRLRGLSREGTARMIEALTRIEPSEGFSAAVHERSGGCPLLIVQLLETEWSRAALADEAATLATSIDLRRPLIEAATRQLQGLSVETRDALTWGAVLGKTFGFELLGRVTGLTPDELLDRLEEGQRVDVVQRDGVAEYGFVHPIVGDVLYKALGASERAARHRRVALALEAHFAATLDLHAGAIAHHLVRAMPIGTAREAFDYASRAARFSMSRGDARAAAKHWGRAVRALEFTPGREEAGLDARVELARAYLLIRDVERARAALLDASLLAHALGRAEALARRIADLELQEVLEASEIAPLVPEAGGGGPRRARPRLPR